MPTESADANSLTRRSVRGFLWAVFSFGGGKLIVFGSTLVLARLLTPEAFGVIAAGLAFIAYLQVLLDLGVGATVIYEQEEGVGRRVQVAWTLNVVLAVVLGIAGVLLAPTLASFFGVSDQANVFRVLSLSVIVTACALVPTKVLERDLNFRRRVWIELVPAAVRATVAISLALAGFEVWALVIGYLAGEIVRVPVAWGLLRFLPRFVFDIPILKSMLGYSLYIFGVSVVNSIADYGDYFIVGGVLGATALGFYTIAYKVPEMLLDSVYWVFSSVVFPAYSAAREIDAESLRSAVVRSLGVITLWGFSAGTLIALAADDVMVVVFGEKWLPAAAPMVLVGIGLGLRSVRAGVSDVFPATGHPRTLMLLLIPETTVVLTAMVAVSSRGLTYIAGVLVVAELVFGSIQTILAARLIGLKLGRVGRSLRGGFVAALGVVAVAAWPAILVPPSLWGLVLTVCGGILGAAIMLSLFGRETISDLRSIANQAMSGRRSAGG
ncbi:MAG: lipopolysaccharide biosynthesis protein [Actinomycetia bacterium]|nr:lipopolysaccharide biosynthesis protein [Actinomycetes bacterium]MCH9702036.1 lipopolysaccharide biosynthesis protein [Actinomycetes bacterium]MCH9759755.1 lipopolysaccharide biosynthesis protein [Actinomycetes bacterium]